MIRLEPAGAEALLLVLGEQAEADLPLRIAALAERIRRELGDLLIDLVPGWTSLLLHYDLLRTDHLRLAERLAPLLEAWLDEPAPSGAGACTRSQCGMPARTWPRWRRPAACPAPA